MRIDGMGEVGDCPEDATTREMAYYGSALRALVLLEALADDHFPDEAAFHAWIQRQQRINLRRTPPEGQR